MDPLLKQFHRQYLQQVTNLMFPPPKLLKHSDVQHQLYKYFFDNKVDAYLPPPEYQRRVLKKLISDIEYEAKDEDDEVSDDLMSHMGYLSSQPKRSELEAAQTPRVLSYFLPDSALPKADNSTFENRDGLGDYSSPAVPRVLIKESPQLLAAGSNVGLRTWEACLRLAYCLSTSTTRSSLKGANVLELGAGTGLLSLICSMKLGAKYVCATDGLMHVVEGIEGNITLNKEAHSGQLDMLKMPSARILNWTDLSKLDEILSVDEKRVEFDYILGADITYHPELHEALASLILKLTNHSPSCRVLITFTVRNEATLNSWKETCNGHGLVIHEINEKDDDWVCPRYWLQTGLFHEQAFPIVIMDITRAKQELCVREVDLL